jgi:hypothetical protein
VWLKAVGDDAEDRAGGSPRVATEFGGAVDEWHIRIDKRYLDPAPGSGARAKEQELAAGKGSVRRFLDRVTDARTEDRSWRLGAEGEERVAAILARCLDERWSVVHDLTIGTKGANLDHLLIGPAGVFTLNTKNLSGRLTVHERAILQNGRKTAFVPSALGEARKVQQRLTAATGRDVTVWSVLVLAGRCEVKVRQRPADLTIVQSWQLPGWIRGLPGSNLTPGEVLTLERAARDPDTWRPRRGGAGGAARVPVAPPAAAGGVPSEVRINRWKRYGKDRFYANASDGTRLGYIDVATGEVVLEVADSTGVVAAQLRAARHAVAG